MNKTILGIILVAILSIAGLGYYFFIYEPAPRYRPVAEPPPPLIYTSLKGITLYHPEATTTNITLTQVYANSQADFPSGRFTITKASSTVSGQLIAFDRLADEGDDGTIVVPIGVLNQKTDSIEYYLGVLEGDTFTHTRSFPVGEDIIVNSVTRDGSRATIRYLTFERGQLRTDAPRLSTEAVFDIKANEIVKVGANVLIEQEIADASRIKKFPMATYHWYRTVTEDGTELAPLNPSTFLVIFEDGQVRLSTDCNTANAAFTFGVDYTVTIEKLKRTSKFCSSDLEKPFFDAIENVDSFEFTDGRLTLFGTDTTELFDPRNVTVEDLEMGTSEDDVDTNEVNADSETTATSTAAIES